MKARSRFLFLGAVLLIFSACATTQPEPVATGKAGQPAGQEVYESSTENLNPSTSDNQPQPSKKRQFEHLGRYPNQW
jgi:hypothetical protein